MYAVAPPKQGAPGQQDACAFYCHASLLGGVNALPGSSGKGQRGVLHLGISRTLSLAHLVFRDFYLYPLAEINYRGEYNLSEFWAPLLENCQPSVVLGTSELVRGIRREDGLMGCSLPKAADSLGVIFRTVKSQA